MGESAAQDIEGTRCKVCAAVLYAGRQGNPIQVRAGVHDPPRGEGEANEAMPLPRIKAQLRDGNGPQPDSVERGAEGAGPFIACGNDAIPGSYQRG